MRDTLPDFVEDCRVQWGPLGSDKGYGLNGAFLIPGPRGARLRVIVSNGTHPDARGWEHVSVSVSVQNRCPNWPEMCYIKDLFWDEEEVVVQFHPAKSEYVNHHPSTLHLWRNRVWEFAPFETPPSILVGPK